MLDESTTRFLHAKAENGCHLAIPILNRSPIRHTSAQRRLPNRYNSSSNICDNLIVPKNRPSDPSINCGSQHDVPRLLSIYFPNRCFEKIIADGNDA